MISTLLKQGHFPWDDALRRKLLKIGQASIDRHLKSFRSFERRRKNSGTRPGSQIFKSLIPIKGLDVISSRCGHLEADTVAQCGGNMGGDFRVEFEHYRFFFGLDGESSGLWKACEKRFTGDPRYFIPARVSRDLDERRGSANFSVSDGV